MTDICRVVDQRGKPVQKQGKTGNIQIYNPSPMMGYLNNPLATAETLLSDGWVTSGDVGYVKNGNWYIVDRTKDLIKVRGWQVSPAEIETVLLEHSDVIDAGVIGIPAKDGCGDVPMAYIVRSVGSTLREEEVKSFLGARLARYKGVEEVVFIEKIPRNPTGKILRRVLRDSRPPQEVTEAQQAAAEYSNALKRLMLWRRAQKTPKERVAKVEEKKSRTRLFRRCRLIKHAHAWQSTVKISGSG